MSKQKTFQFGYQNRAGKDWKPDPEMEQHYDRVNREIDRELYGKEGSPVSKKPIAAKPMTREEFEAYKAQGAFRHSGGSYVNGKWVYPTSVPWDDDLIDTGSNKTIAVSAQASSSTSTSYVRCYESHPPLELGNGLKIYGGSCHTPKVADADIYVALDGGYRNTERHWPWHKRHCQEIRFPITDMSTPEKPEAYLQLIAWLVEQIKAGKKVHVGCIGGHGRTGMILVGVYRAINPDDNDAIQAVRAKYCKKVVESDSQVAFLMKHTGCSKAPPSKTWSSSSTKLGSGTRTGGSTSSGSTSSWWDEKGKYKGSGGARDDFGPRYATPMNSASCIWGPKAAKS